MILKCRELTAPLSKLYIINKMDKAHTDILNKEFVFKIFDLNSFRKLTY